MVRCWCEEDGDMFYSDDFCGNFTIDCGEEPESVWESELVVTGTVSVYYAKGCSDGLLVTILLDGILQQSFIVPLAIESAYGNTRSFTVREFNEIQITCIGEGEQSCAGTYCINAHYFRDQES
ncbi:S-Ena type endospore appendage [Halobacillus sp. HZG1]|uniref:DUF3992 domain-containing protein n=1 Tax=Halobacillus sp. HZG1 TaxID=3111769 RepID=UPI002DB79F42|nr:S-Ena type endospore appendage [Halobacillus sp. HZG1]MEC3885354.1 S-Ena type endospore appendage [Halobacillus sp. HZG1]